MLIAKWKVDIGRSCQQNIPFIVATHPQHFQQHNIENKDIHYKIRETCPLRRNLIINLCCGVFGSPYNAALNAVFMS
jgi:hypothetical protein